MNDDKTGIYDSDGEPWTPNPVAVVLIVILFVLAMIGVVVTVWGL